MSSKKIVIELGLTEAQELYNALAEANEDYLTEGENETRLIVMSELEDRLAENRMQNYLDRRDQLG